VIELPAAAKEKGLSILDVHVARRLRWPDHASHLTALFKEWLKKGNKFALAAPKDESLVDRIGDGFFS
jgi:hypothetical protein